MIVARLAVGVFWLLLALPTVLVVSLFIKRQDYDVHSRFCRGLLEFTTGWALFSLGVKIVVNGAEKLPEIGRFLMVANHVSNFDPLVMWYAFRGREIAFVSKPENFSIPGYGRLIRKCCFLAIDRSNARRAIRTIYRAANLLENDVVSIGVFPEGTRNREGGLLPFHNGVFQIAQRAGVPLIDVVVRNTQDISTRAPWRTTRVVLDVLCVRSAEELSSVRSGELGEQIHAEMQAAL